MHETSHSTPLHTSTLAISDIKQPLRQVAQSFSEEFRWTRTASNFDIQFLVFQASTVFVKSYVEAIRSCDVGVTDHFSGRTGSLPFDDFSDVLIVKRISVGYITWRKSSKNLSFYQTMDDVLLLFLLALAMLVCSFVAGNLPLVVTLSEVRTIVILFGDSYSISLAAKTANCNSPWRWVVSGGCVSSYHSRRSRSGLFSSIKSTRKR